MARKKHTLGCLFYVALILLVLVVFLFNRKTVQEVMEKTGFTRLFERRTEAPPQVEVVPPEEQSPEGRPAQREPEAEQAPVPEPRADGEEQVVVTVAPPERQQTPPREKRSAPPEKAPERTRQARMYYVAVGSDGRIELKGVTRPVQYTDAPLTATLQALLKGPAAAEVNQGLITMIPTDTRLLRASVRDGTAYLDFNEAFRFNSLGKEGQIAQLQQVVFCATEFPSVKQVQFLIEGSVSEYLGPEGLYIGKPLSRESFRN
jgi:germination protein M